MVVLNITWSFINLSIIIIYFSLYSYICFCYDRKPHISFWFFWVFFIPFIFFFSMSRLLHGEIGNNFQKNLKIAHIIYAKLSYRSLRWFAKQLLQVFLTFGFFFPKSWSSRWITSPEFVLPVAITILRFQMCFKSISKSF
jgi:hypothetical protein